VRLRKPSRHMAAQAATDAVADDPDGCPEHLREEENEALDELAWTPCGSDAEFRYYVATSPKHQISPDSSLPVASAAIFENFH
jgi:hypothetical protein